MAFEMAFRLKSLVSRLLDTCGRISEGHCHFKIAIPLHHTCVNVRLPFDYFFFFFALPRFVFNLEIGE